MHYYRYKHNALPILSLAVIFLLGYAAMLAWGWIAIPLAGVVTYVSIFLIEKYYTVEYTPEHICDNCKE